MEYLFGRWDKLKKRLSAKVIILFLDYDGTLAPIAETPGKAVISQETKRLLQELSGSPACKIAIISGRSLGDIKNRVGLKNIVYVGNHGLELAGPKIKFRSPVSPRYKAILEHIKSGLSRKLSSIKGVFLEDKGLSLGLHYRLVDKKYIAKVKTIFHETVILYLVKNEVKIKTGKMVLEIRPPTEWDKGKIVLWLLSRQRFALKGRKILPVYIGDDVTDEDAFLALRNKGLTVFVGRPKDSHAQYYVKSPEDVAEFLRRLCQN